MAESYHLTVSERCPCWQRSCRPTNLRGRPVPFPAELSGGHMRKTLFSIAVGAMIAPVVVSAQDADKKVTGGGELAPGWQTRVDPRAGSGTPAKFVVMGNGLHAT